MSADLLIALIDVYKIYKDESLVETVALRGVSLSVCRGEFTAVVGPSGCGKTTLLNVVSGKIRPSAGNVYWRPFNRDISMLSDSAITRMRRRFMGFILQEGNLLPHLTALQNVSFAGTLGGLSPRPANRRASELLRDMRISTTQFDLHPMKLSGGERQRVAIASAMVNDPQLILADEPTGSVDLETGEQILGILADLNQGGDTAILVVTHSQQVATFAQRTLEIRDGVLAGVHESEDGVVLRDLSASRRIRLDSQNRVPIPQPVLEQLGMPMEFRIRVDQQSIVLDPVVSMHESHEKSTEKSESVRSKVCAVCRKSNDGRRTFCSHCGSLLTNANKNNSPGGDE